MDGHCTSGHTSEANCIDHARGRSQYNLWVVLAMNLVLTGNLPLIAKLDPETMETWSNPEVPPSLLSQSSRLQAIAINQDPTVDTAPPGRYPKRLDNGKPLSGSMNLGPQGYTQANLQECGGEPEKQVWEFDQPAKGYLRNAASAECMAIDDCQEEIIYDSCETGSGTTCAGKGNFSHFEWYLQNGQIRSMLRADTCMTVGDDNVLNALPCQAAGEAKQTFQYTTEKQLTNSASGKSLCVTASTAVKPGAKFGIFGRALKDGSWGVVFLNNSPANMTVTCDPDCMAKMGLASTSVVVRDIWLHQNVTTVQGSLSLPVPANGASRLLRLYSDSASGQ